MYKISCTSCRPWMVIFMKENRLRWKKILFVIGLGWRFFYVHVHWKMYSEKCHWLQGIYIQTFMFDWWLLIICPVTFACLKSEKRRRYQWTRDYDDAQMLVKIWVGGDQVGGGSETRVAGRADWPETRGGANKNRWKQKSKQTGWDGKKKTKYD